MRIHREDPTRRFGSGARGVQSPAVTALEWNDVAGDAESPQGAGDAGRAELLQRLTDGLNEPQAAAVTHDAGPLLILAGAGSGKTRVITRRIAWLVATGRADSRGLLAITFTNKAAKEMRERVGALIPTGGMWISTFHAMCARILRRDIEHLGGYTRDFSIYDTADRNQLIKQVVKDLGYDTTRFRPAAVGSWISEAKSQELAPDASAVDLSREGFEYEVLKRVQAAYLERMAASNALDFDDLLLLTLRLFEQHRGVRDAYAHNFRHVLVDEYQDTNRVQYLLVRHLASAHGNLAVCGDPDQSIYAWRGADINNILDFERDFPGAEVVKLEQNYRSTKNILAAAQSVIGHNSSRKPKELWSAGEAGPPVHVLECGDENEEADQIARQVLELQSEGQSLDGIAVFYRVNFMQRALERGLRLAGIPYRIAGGVEFYQRKEIRDLLSYLSLIMNPSDDVACRRVVNVPPRGIGDKSMEVLSGWAADRRVPLTVAVASEEARLNIRGRAKKSLAAFAGLLEQLNDLAKTSAEEVLDAVIDATDFFGYLTQLNDNMGEGREENVEELMANARAFDSEQPDGGLRGFLEDVALVSEVDGLGAQGQDGTQVSLMTLHAAKGLEFPVVFLPGLEEDLLPHQRSVAEDAGDGGAGLEEERRLFYVGLTRAMSELRLSHASTRMYFGETSWRRPSRFLEELPDGTLEAARAAESEEQVLGEFEGGDVDLDEGDFVRHPHFGAGQIERLAGKGANARATVRFMAAGSKTLLLQYAKLERVQR